VPISDVGHKKGNLPVSKAIVEKTEEAEDEVPSVLNIVGLRVDEALSRLEPFLNHAFLSGLEEVTVIHGIGTGALLKAVRNYLAGHSLVNRYRSKSQFEEGITIVTMK
jgi:DNA mismatch repair protein MutS2